MERDQDEQKVVSKQQLGIDDVWFRVAQYLNNRDFLALYTTKKGFKSKLGPFLKSRYGTAKLTIMWQSTFCLFDGGVYGRNALYSWGHNEAGMLGLGHEKEQHLPQRVRLPDGEKVNKIISHATSTWCITKNRFLYAWGDNRYGQLGVQIDRYTRIDYRCSPQRVKLPNEKMKVSKFFTNGSNYPMSFYCFCLTTDGTILAWGNNGAEGRLGLGYPERVIKPQIVQLPTNELVTQLYMSNSDSIFAVTDSGCLYVWGANQSGQLGLGHTNIVITPQKVYFPNHEKVAKIFIDGRSIFCITQCGKLFTWGENKNGYLCLNSQANYIEIPTQVSLPNNVILEEVVACRSAVFAVSNKRQLYACYCSGKKNENQLQLIEFNDNETVSQIELHARHSGGTVSIITSAGKLYLYGKYYDRNKHAQSFIDRLKRMDFPTKVEVTQVVIGKFGDLFHSITKDSKLYGWGTNANGELGFGSEINKQETPKLIELPNKEKISEVVTNGETTLYATQEGNVYGCGDNAFGQLGQGHDHKKVYERQPIYFIKNKAIKIYFSEFKKHSFFHNENPAQKANDNTTTNRVPSSHLLSGVVPSMDEWTYCYRQIVRYLSASSHSEDDMDYMFDKLDYMFDKLKKLNKEIANYHKNKNQFNDKSDAIVGQLQEFVTTGAIFEYQKQCATENIVVTNAGKLGALFRGGFSNKIANTLSVADAKTLACTCRFFKTSDTLQNATLEDGNKLSILKHSG